MKSLKLALKKQPIVYIARDLERALGLSRTYQNYYIITNSSLVRQKLIPKNQKNIITIKSTEVLDTHELLTHPKTKQFLSKLQNPHLLVFKNTPTIEKICQEHGWQLLNPPAAPSSTIEEKISQVEWLGELKKLLPPHRIDVLKNLSWSHLNSPQPSLSKRGNNTSSPSSKEGAWGSYILQFNRAHTGNGTLLIESEDQLKGLRQKFPNRPVRITEFIDGPMFTNNNIVWGKKILCGSINYQITGLSPFTDRPFATIGNDWALPHQLLSKKLQAQYVTIAKSVGKKLAKEGWRGLFGIDVVYDKKRKKLYLIEINARQPASTTYESQLQQRQTSNVKRQKLVTTFEAHLASVLGLEYEGEKLIQLEDGAQIIQRVTKNIKHHISNSITEKLTRLKCNLITYNNKKEGDDLIRIQSKKSIMKNHAEFNPLGQTVQNTIAGLSTFDL